MSMTRALKLRAHQLPLTSINGIAVVKDFAVLIDVRPDIPLVGTFADGLVRGQCKPVMVHYEPLTDSLFDGQTIIPRDKRHIFMSIDDWSSIVMDWALSGFIPKDGVVPTSKFRDARKRVYKYRSFRSLIMARWKAEKAVGTLVK